MDKNGYLIQLSESERTAFGRIAFSEQSREQQIFSAIWALESRVNSGGFDSSFSHEEADLVAFAPTALRAIGAVACAEIVSRAIALASGGQLGAVAGELESLDSEFFVYPDNLTELLFEFVSVNEATFGAIRGVA